jgi:hypothetical protein
MEDFLRDKAISWWHQSDTAKMGRDSLSVVDSNLKVYGIKNLRIADGSIMSPGDKRQHYGAVRHHWRTRSACLPRRARRIANSDICADALYTKRKTPSRK